MNNTAQSEDKMKKQIDLNKITVNEQKIIKNIKKNWKLFCLKIFVIIFIILISSIGLFILFILFNQKKSNDVNTEGESEKIINIEEINYISKLNKNNSITAVYSFEKGKEVILFNPEKIDLSENNYKIEILSKIIMKRIIHII